MNQNKWTLAVLIASTLLITDGARSSTAVATQGKKAVPNWADPNLDYSADGGSEYLVPTEESLFAPSAKQIDQEMDASGQDVTSIVKFVETTAQTQKRLPPMASHLPLEAEPLARPLEPARIPATDSKGRGHQVSQ